MQYTAMRLSPEDRAYLDERYGVNQRQQWPVYIVAVIVAAFVAWIAWAYWAQIHPKVTSAETTYVLGTSANAKTKAWKSTVTYQVNRANKNVDATCTAQALGTGQQVIGTGKQSPFAGKSATTVTVVMPIISYARPLAINWIGCTAPGQNAPK